uniref:Uncharacterized protein n=1 Tax=Acrobeloides nanus TaxID=290746 RepID=A0A914DXV0_9BILA
MRRTRRVIQRITARLREKNFNTIERARNVRKRRRHKTCNGLPSLAPPLYIPNCDNSGSSPPPTYEDALLDQYYQECMPINQHRNIKKQLQ